MKTYSEMMAELKKSAEENNLPSVITVPKIDLKSTETLITIDSVVDPTDSDNQFRKTLNELNRIADDFKNTGLTFKRPMTNFRIRHDIAVKLRDMRDDLNKFLITAETPREPTRVSESNLTIKIGKPRTNIDFTGMDLDLFASSATTYGHRSLRYIHEHFDYVYLSRSARHPKADFKKKPLERLNGKKEIKPSKFLLAMVKKVKA
jgi:hypothetical protein